MPLPCREELVNAAVTSLSRSVTACGLQVGSTAPAHASQGHSSRSAESNRFAFEARERVLAASTESQASHSRVSRHGARPSDLIAELHNCSMCRTSGADLR